jgi:hypothetical protein
LGYSVTTAEVVQIVVAVSVPIVTAVLGVLGIMFQDWRVRRTQAGGRKLALEEASRQASFAAEWWNARRLLADSPEEMREAAPRALAWLEEASALVMESRPPRVGERPPITVRRLLLLYSLQRRTAKIIRGFFYALLGPLLYMTGYVISDTISGLDTPYFLPDVIVMTVMALFTLSFRFLAGFIEKQRPGHEERRRITIRRALLLYRLHQRAANIIRIIFYVWIASAMFWALTVVAEPVEDPSWLPIGMALFIASIGYAAGFRYWAASLGTIRDTKEASSTRSSPPPLH